MMPSFASLALFLLLSARSFTLITAQNASSCDSTTTPNIHASYEQLIRDLFRSPTGLFSDGSSDWNWNIATTTHNLTSHGTKGTVQENLWLETESFIDLTTPTLGYMGCGAILHGLTYAATVNGQSDDGFCSSLLSINCTTAIAQSVINTATLAANLTDSATNGSIGAVALRHNLTFPIPRPCYPFFTPSSWIQTFVFASPQLNAICSTAPAARNASNALVSWGQATYFHDNMTPYADLTTQIAPLITAMFTNLPASASPQGLNNSNSIFVAPRLTCLRPRWISQGSLTAHMVPTAGDGSDMANLNGQTLSPTAVAAATASARASAVTATGDAEGLTIQVMDWLSLLGICTLFGKVLLA
jgi:hypothetical protein